MQKRLLQIIYVCLGTYLVWAANNILGLDPVLASASVALIGVLMIKDHQGIFMAGTLAGMSLRGALPYWWCCLIVGAIIFALWVLIDTRLEGVGGNWGLIACVSGALAMIPIVLLTSTLSPDVYTVETAIIRVDLWGQFLVTNGLWWIPCSIIFCMLGAVATIWVRKNIITPLLGKENTILACALVGVLGYLVVGVIVSWGMPIPTIPAIGASLADYQAHYAALALNNLVVGQISIFIYIGALAGMASQERIRFSKKQPLEKIIPNEYLAFMLVGLIAGGLNLFIIGWLPYGGLVGFTAAWAVIIYDQVLAKYVLKEADHNLRTFK